MKVGGNSGSGAGSRSGSDAWRDVVRKYQEASPGRAAWQLTDTLGPYVLLWAGMHFALEFSLALALPLAVLAGAFLVRIFAIFHDCTHGSFFGSRRANDITGFITGVLTFTPYHHWRWEHLNHHVSAADLGRRGVGDIPTMTVREYLAASRWKRFRYRLSRNPVVLFGIAPLFLFLIRQRFPSRKAGAGIRWWTHATTLAVVGLGGGLAWWYGPANYLVLQLTSMLVAASAGVWLFYVQHQFDGVYWDRRPGWDFVRAALEGSSYYRLPKVLQWFTGSIGFHHIHHLSPRIPNYRLESAQKKEPVFAGVKPLTLPGSLRSLRFRLWDEDLGTLTGYPRRAPAGKPLSFRP